MAQLAGLPDVGAQVCFVGQVRDFGDNQGSPALELEHYPGMTEKSLLAIPRPNARAGRWRRRGWCTGWVSAAGRKYIVLVLSPPAPIAATPLPPANSSWITSNATRRSGKKNTAAGSHWQVEAKHSDQQAAQRWQ